MLISRNHLNYIEQYPHELFSMHLVEFFRYVHLLDLEVFQVFLVLFHDIVREYVHFVHQ